MSVELYFIYDSHCPWSYAATRLVDNIVENFPKVQLQLMHCAYFDGDNKVSAESVEEVQRLSNIHFNNKYKESLSDNRDSTLAANILTWVQRKSPKHGLALLKSIQKAHFEDANALLTKDDIDALITNLKLSPPAKTLQSDKFTKDTEFALNDIGEIQEIIGTNAIPALLLAHNENLILLNHNFYLATPEKIVEAVQLELDK